jgi:hypothetical protein
VARLFLQIQIAKVPGAESRLGQLLREFSNGSNESAAGRLWADFESNSQTPPVFLDLQQAHAPKLLNSAKTKTL